MICAPPHRTCHRESEFSAGPETDPSPKPDDLTNDDNCSMWPVVLLLTANDECPNEVNTWENTAVIRTVSLISITNHWTGLRAPVVAMTRLEQ